MDILEAIKTVGFPIAVAAWVLVRLNGKMDKLTSAVLSLSATMDRYVTHTEDVMKVTSARDDQRTSDAVQRVLAAISR